MDCSSRANHFDQRIWQFGAWSFQAQVPLSSQQRNNSCKTLEKQANLSMRCIQIISLSYFYLFLMAPLHKARERKHEQKGNARKWVIYNQFPVFFSVKYSHWRQLASQVNRLRASWDLNPMTICRFGISFLLPRILPKKLKSQLRSSKKILAQLWVYFKWNLSFLTLYQNKLSAKQNNEKNLSSGCTYFVK